MEVQNLAKAESISWGKHPDVCGLRMEAKTQIILKQWPTPARDITTEINSGGGELIEDKMQIKDEILRYYQNLYTETKAWRSTTNFEDVPNLICNDVDMLE